MVKVSRESELHLKPVDSRKQRAMHMWNRNVLVLFIVFLLALGVTFGRPFDLQSCVAHGHALWFLLLPAYPLLGIIGVLNAIFHLENCGLMHYLGETNPALGLALLDMVTLGIVWLAIRKRGFRWFGASGVRAAATFVLILYAWGIFQLGLTGIMILTHTGSGPQAVPPQPPAAVQEVQR